MTQMTQPDENQRYLGRAVVNWPQGFLATTSIDLADGQVGWSLAQLRNHDITTAILTMQLSARQQL